MTQSREAEITLQPGNHIHLVGIGGFGLSAIARVLLGKGYVVSGSDLQLNELTSELMSAGAVIYEGHKRENCQGADILLVSSAVPMDNEEVAAAHEEGIPVLKRAEFLSILMIDSYGIAVAGSHGKTTTTGMIAQIMIEAGLDPSVIVGGVLPTLGSNGRAGKSDFFVIEADEYDYMFLGLRPNLAVITNIEYDHPDLFRDKAAYVDAFRTFVTTLPAGSSLVVCSDDPAAAGLASEASLTGQVVDTYGLNQAAWQAVELRPNQIGGTDFLVKQGQDYSGPVRLRVPGEHNVLNALAAIAVTVNLGVGFNVIRQALAEFGGIGRRFQIVGEVGDVTIIDDYAHHPTEIRTTLAAARQRYLGRRIWAVWQPHTFSRTKSMLTDFAHSFDNADRVVALDIYQSRETDTLGVDTPGVLRAMDHPEAYHLATKEEAALFLLDRVRPGDVIITLSAGDGNLVGEMVLNGLQERISGSQLTDKNSNHVMD